MAEKLRETQQVEMMKSHVDQLRQELEALVGRSTFSLQLVHFIDLVDVERGKISGSDKSLLNGLYFFLLQDSKKSELNIKIATAKTGVTEFTSAIDGMRLSRDMKLAEIEQGQQEVDVRTILIF